MINEAVVRRWHARQAAMKRDRDRDFAAAQVGVITVRFLHEHLTSDMDACAEGLRRVVAPALAVQMLVTWTVPFVDYVPLLVLLAISGLFVVPGHALIRQSLITAVGEEQRRTALSLDGMVLELSAAIGPAIAVAIVEAIRPNAGSLL